MSQSSYNHRDRGDYNRGGPKRPYDGEGRHGDRGQYSDRRFGGGGRWGGGRGGGGRHDDVPRPTECLVFTNFNRLEVFQDSFDPPDRYDFVRYKVLIKDMVMVAEEVPDSDKKVMKLKPKDISRRDDDERSKRRFFSKPLPWRIMKKLEAEESSNDRNFVLAYDGAEIAIAPKCSSVCSRAPPLEFDVKVKVGCDENDPDADRVKSRVYRVELVETNVIPFSHIISAVRGGKSETNGTEALSAAVNIILKSVAINAGMLTLDPRLPATYFPLDVQTSLFGRTPPETHDRTRFLLQGVQQSAIFTNGGDGSQGSVFVQTDPCVAWVDKERFDTRDSALVPLLVTNGRYPSIAGVEIRSANQPITDPDKQKQITEALSKRSFNISYKIVKSDPKILEAHRAKGRSEEWIERSRNVILKEQVSRKDKNHGHAQIIWSACDPNLYSFEKDGRRFTVKDHFREKYGIRLEFPNMPIICVGKLGWFPIEFVFQSFAKTRDANDNEMVTAVLHHYDAHAGTNLIKDVKKKLGILSTEIVNRGDSVRVMLEKFNLFISEEPVELKAKVLKAPTIQFLDRKASCNNGSFNLQGMKFSRAAKMHSYMVVNFSRDERLCDDFVSRLMDVSQAHGIEIPSVTKEINRITVTVPYRGRNAIDDALDILTDAKEIAYNIYICDSSNIFRRKNVWFKTVCCDDSGVERECIILPPVNNGSVPGLLLNYNVRSEGDFYFSHKIETIDGKFYEGRLMVKIRETDQLIDPLDFRYDQGGYQAIDPSGDWVNVIHEYHCYECRDQNGDRTVVEERDIRQTSFKHFADDFKIDFPSLFLVCLPDNGKALYDRIKFLSNQIGGIQTQCAIMSKFKSQKNKDQYASNIATKINAKLSTLHDKAVSWTSPLDENRGRDEIPWVGECPTLVMGIGMAHGLGNASDTVICAYVCLDSGCMRLSNCCFLQNKSDVVTSDVMKDITKTLWNHYVLENKNKPERILVFRDGMSDGNFTRADDEISSMREALRNMDHVNCSCKLGCVLCNPPITYVICQSQHSIRMVPADDKQGFESRKGANINVHSGTCLDHTVMEFTKCQISNDDKELIRKSNLSTKEFFGPVNPNFDFLLTSQGGLKGTSKPIFERIRLNENAVWGPPGTTALSKENLQTLTYHMCWKYPSATKAVREVPVVKYAKKLANQVLGGLKFIREGATWFGETFKLVYPSSEGDGDDKRIHILVTTAGDPPTTSKKYNLLETPFRSHLAA